MWPLSYSPLSGKWSFFNLIIYLYIKSFPNSPCMYNSLLNYTKIITKKSKNIKYYYLLCFSSNHWLATMVQYPTQQSKIATMKRTTMNRAQGWLSDKVADKVTLTWSLRAMPVCVCAPEEWTEQTGRESDLWRAKVNGLPLPVIRRESAVIG